MLPLIIEVELRLGSGYLFYLLVLAKILPIWSKKIHGLCELQHVGIVFAYKHLGVGV